jgi:hypothetical protein
MHQALRLLYGRANLAHQRQRSEAEDVMAFTNECTAEQLFDFIEASFKLDVPSRIFGEENEFVAALIRSSQTVGYMSATVIASGATTLRRPRQRSNHWCPASARGRKQQPDDGRSNRRPSTLSTVTVMRPGVFNLVGG